VERAARTGHAEAFLAYVWSNQPDQAEVIWTQPPALLRERFVGYTTTLDIYQGLTGQAAARALRNEARLMNDLLELPEEQGVGPPDP
jgi:hypothetical protein